MEANERAQKVLGHVLTGTLQLLHPFMPFITESIWQALPHEGKSIMVSAWPKFDESLQFPGEEEQLERIMEAIRAIRNRRSEMNVPPSRKANILISTAQTGLFQAAAPFMKKLAYAAEVEVADHDPADTAGMVSVVTGACKLFMPMSDLVDMEKERERLQKEKDNLLQYIARTEAKLQNVAFVAKAPAAVVNAEREKLQNKKEHLAKLEESLRLL